MRYDINEKSEDGEDLVGLEASHHGLADAKYPAAHFVGIIF